MKKSLSRSHTRPAALLLCLLLTVQLLLQPVPVHAEKAKEESSTPISGTEEFLRFASGCSSSAYSAGKRFSLEADIDLSGTDFQPVPWFGGVLEGNGHSIRGLLFDGAGSRQGLFRTVAPGAELRNLKVSGTVTPGGTASLVGGIAGVNRGSIVSCVFEGNVSGLETVGGIVGHNTAEGTVTGCRFSGSLSGEHQAGGIAGLNDGTVSHCISSGAVNTTAPSISTGSADLRLMERNFDISQLSEDDFLSITNIGGIAGWNTGILDRCVNNGPVGYPSVGYNVGGIAGRTDGFISACENSAAVLGRRDVGGIAGQLIPFSDWDLSSGKLDGLSWQIELLNMYLAGLMSNISSFSTELSDSFSRIQTDTADLLNAFEALVRVPNENVSRILDSIMIDPETGEIVFTYPELAQVDLSAISVSLMNLYGESLYLSELAQQSTGNLSSDLRLVAAQISNVFNSLFSTVSAAADVVPETEDLSEKEAYTRNTGAIALCSNSGNVSCDTNGGGILGNASFEVEFDMEDRLNTSELLTSRAKHNLFAAVRDCSCVATVESKDSISGGIAGSMDLGIVTGCVFTGAVKASSGDYVGGIIGLSRGAVRSCWARVLLAGTKYIGGIAGLCDKAEDCRSWVHFDAQEEYAGAVAGWSDGSMKGNLYADASPAGVDGVSISGECDPLTEEAFLALPGRPEQLGNVQVRFVAEGRVIAEETVPFGGTLQNIPSVENRDGRYWVWHLPEQDRIFSALVIEGEYRSPKSTLASEEDPPHFLVEGQFYEGQTLQVIPASPPDVPGESLSAWSVTVSGVEAELTIRMLTAEEGQLWLVGEDGTPVRSSHSRDGSYVVFRMPNGGAFCYAVEEAAGRKLPVPSGPALFAITVFILLALFIIFSERRRRREEARARARAREKAQARAREKAETPGASWSDAPESSADSETPDSSQS